mmetsp:Transcript_6805/g.12631  ORF Transcript_6805/g.12631 Transcript_6805/m.12631 type:complete len:200 (-) Transcript_6805:167-766(-)
MSALSTPLPNLALRTLDDGVDTTVLELAAGRNLVIDFWTTRCERCPAALSKLNDLAGEMNKEGRGEDSLFLSVCLDDEEFGKELVEEGDWGNMTHAFMEPKEKEAAKAEWGFSAVPFLVVAVQGRVIAQGSPKVVTLEVIQEAFAAPAALDGATTETPIDVIEAAASASSPPTAASSEGAPEPSVVAGPVSSFNTDEDF